MKNLLVCVFLATSLQANAQSEFLLGFGNPLPYTRGDTVEVFPDGFNYILKYENSKDSLSGGGWGVIQIDGLEIKVFIQIQARDWDEKITVVPPDGFVAYPEEMFVKDGEEVEILITPVLG